MTYIIKTQFKMIEILYIINHFVYNNGHTKNFVTNIL